MQAAEQIVVRVAGGRTLDCPASTPVKMLLPAPKDANGLHYLGAIVNNQVVTLEFMLEVESDVRFLTFRDPAGWRIYRGTATFLLGKVIKELFPDARFSVEHSLGNGFYCFFGSNGREGITAEQLAAVDQRLRALVAQDLPLNRHKVTFAEAMRVFEAQGQRDKLNLLRFRNPPKVVVYSCEAFTDLAHAPLAASTGALTHFNLAPYETGFVIQFPDRSTPPRVPPLRGQPQLFRIYQEHKKWGRTLGVTNVGRLNELIAAQETGDFIKTTEAFHEKKIAQIADLVCGKQPRVRWLLIAGPSSSGKTTFAKRLAVQLRVNGVRPVTISVDNYFVDRAHTPKDEKGENDYEHIEAIDLKLFHEHLRTLDEGGEIDVPSFNFHEGRREYKGTKLRLAEDQMAILEGIHGLNPRLTEVIQPPHKFKVYISALTQLNLDSSNRISTTDNRLIRRMVRDNQFRGHPALTTMGMWPSVRRGEKTWIFPYQDQADIAFNSALDYELAVLKPFVEPLLAEVKPHHEHYGEARRLQDFLRSFLVIPADLVPPTSILREFIGKSSFRY